MIRLACLVRLCPCPVNHLLVARNPAPTIGRLLLLGVSFPAFHPGPERSTEAQQFKVSQPPEHGIELRVLAERMSHRPPAPGVESEPQVSCSARSSSAASRSIQVEDLDGLEGRLD